MKALYLSQEKHLTPTAVHYDLIDPIILTVAQFSGFPLPNLPYDTSEDAS